ncbi:lipocalin family protein [Thermomonas sp.]|uniref:lipocalin family protein n=1 Tax=Thermomonas sp. TaxID=1971895 RepID=UPI001AD2E07D|nr:lipocalin family protein [Xanthomonadales bacterium]MBN8768351.1 lipocalin family protein [Stenotrophomonas sp.]
MPRPLAFVLALAACTAAAQEPPALPNAPVPALDLQRYAGSWHEIAHLPMFFQRQCVADISATYSLRADGLIGVRNACRTRDGRFDVSDGVARRVPGQPGALQVRFAPDWLAWLPFTWADYWVVELDPDYRWAVVGSPSRKYLWVLSRTPAMPRAEFEAIRERAAHRGYPVQRLVLPQGTLE